MKKLLSIVLVVLMVISLMPTAFALDFHSHPMSVDCSTGNGESLVYISLNEMLDISNRLVTGNYYLTDDIVIEDADDYIKVSTGTVNICLNGHKIISTVEELGYIHPVFEVSKGAKLSICDCKGIGEIQSGSDGLMVRGATVNTYGVNIKAFDRGVYVLEGGKFNMNGGKIYAGVFGVQTVDPTDVITLNGGIIGSDSGTAVETTGGGKVNYDNTEICDDLCHYTGFMGFIWKIVNFFNKLFGKNPVCACGKVHY